MAGSPRRTLGPYYARETLGPDPAGRAARWLLLTASLLSGLLIALLTVHLAGPWAGAGHFG